MIEEKFIQRAAFLLNNTFWNKEEVEQVLAKAMSNAFYEGKIAGYTEGFEECRQRLIKEAI